ncbi:MAG: HEAT repeat domain-containing protein [Mariniblastus sp.]
MNKSINDQNSESESNFEDRALDSMLREFGDSCDEGVEFLSRLESQIGPGKFFGRSSLMEQVDFTKPTDVPASEAVVKVPSRSFGSQFWLVALSCVAAVFAAIVAINWILFNASEGSHIARVANEGSVENATEIEVKNADLVIALPKVQREKESSLAPEVGPEKASSPSEPANSAIVDNRSTTNEAVAIEQVPAKPDRDFVWDMKIKFDDENEFARVVLNGKTLFAKVSGRSFDLVLARVSHEVARRVHFVSPVLGEPWVGQIEIDSPSLQTKVKFVGVDEMCEVTRSLRKRARETIEFPPYKFNVLGREAKYPKDALFPKGGLQMLAIARSLELRIIDECVLKAETILQSYLEPDLGNEDLPFLVLEGRSNSKQFQNYRTITPDELLQFQETARLNIPPATDAFLAETSLQETDPLTLKNDLVRASSEISMFGTRDEFFETQKLISGTSLAGRVTAESEKLLSDATVVLERLKKTSDKKARIEIRREHERIMARRQQLLRQSSLAVRRSQSRPAKEVDPIEPLMSLLPYRKDLQGLNLVMGDDCHLAPDNAKTLEVVSTLCGPVLQQFDRFGTRNFDSHTAVRMQAITNMIDSVAAHPKATQALGTLDQMLQIEKPAIRLALVKALHQTNSKIGCGLLTCYARYDLDPEVRVAAVDALRSYPSELYRSNLLDGFQYPWPEVAKHSAEALVRLNDTDAIPALVELLNRPDPRMPQRKGNQIVQRELVAINHMKNCTLCHADSQSKSDSGRGLIPVWGTPLAPQYYGAVSGATVRADVTYLRQDFSVIQPVKDHGPWPENQRFDYVVRESVVSAEQRAAAVEEFKGQPNEYHAAIAKALRLLTKENPRDNSYATWKRIVLNRSKANKSSTRR